MWNVKLVEQDFLAFLHYYSNSDTTSSLATFASHLLYDMGLKVNDSQRLLKLKFIEIDNYYQIIQIN